MASQEFTVLYTHQKTKKSKVWQDGILKATLGGNKATLFDDKGQILDSMFVKFQVKPGDDLESEQYLITIEAQKASETDCSDQPKNAEVPTLIRNNLKSFASSSLHIPVGLKRKHTGFQGPCQVEKKMTTMEASAAVISPSSMAPHSYFPSQFYVNSPLFSVPYKKNEEIDLHFNFSRNTFIANDRNAHSVTSLAFTPYVNDNKVVQSRNHSTDGADAEYLETGIELDNGTVNSNYHASTNVAVLQNVRSKAQILSLLNGEGKHFKVPEDETTASLENVPLTIMKSEFHQKCQLLSEPSRSRESFFKEKIVPLSGSTNNTTKETIKYTVPPHFSEKNVQTKSRWDAYLPSSLTEKSNKDDGEYSNKNVSDLLKDNGTDNRSQYREDHKKMPASLEISISSVKIQPCSIVPPESIRRKENDTEALPSVGSMNYSNCINALKMFEDKHPTFNKYTLIDNLNGFCQQSQNESYPITCSEMNSANSAEGEFGDKQLTEVNFSLLDKLEFSDTEDGKLHMNSTLSQGSVCSKEDTEAQLEISVQKNCDMKACSSEGKGNVQPAFLQDRGVNYVSECQRVQFHEEISEKPNKIEENHVTLPFLKKLQHSKATIINEKIEANAISIQNIGDQRDLGTDLLTVNNMDCEVNNSEHHNPTTHLGKGNVPAVLSSCFMDKSNERGIEVGADSLQPSSIDICDNMKQSNYLLAFTEKYNISHGFPQYILDKHDAASEKNYLDFRPITHPFNCGTSSDESQMSKNEFENAVDSLNFLYKSNEDNKKDSICVKASVDSSSLPQLVNGFSLLKSLTEHSTALESLQMIEENTLSLQKEKQRKKHEATGPEVKQKLAEVLLSEDVQISPCLYSGSPKMNSSELFFPSAEMVNSANVPKRQMYIPAVFQSPAHYKQVFTTALIEHLNILLFELSQKLHKALGKVDISFYMSVKGGQGQENSAPLCNHKTAAKLVMVKKEGRNKGRLFYACDAPKADRCDFFKWLEDINPGHIESRPSIVLHDMKSIGTYLRCQNIYLYEECQFVVRKAFDIQSKRFGKLKKFNSAYANFDYDSKSKIYIKLNRKEHSSVYSKDDLWVVSKTLTFEPLDTFIACSVFFGPSSNNELELVPLKGYSPSNWHSNMIARALLVCNVSTELTTLRNIEENINSATLPIMEHLLKEPFKAVSSSNRINKRKFNPPALNTNTITSGALSAEMSINLANKMIQTFNLNKDQAMALIQIGSMMTSQGIDTEMGKQQALPITVIHGVFGSGKSYLLAIVILFLVQIFETSEATDGKRSVPWKVLISSSTNVAVDRVLLCLLDLGFEEFIRVGSIRKIAKPVLPYSLHAGSGPEHEQLKELLGLMKDDLTPAEKVYVRKTIEHYKLGTNKGLLQQVRVVGATCAACPFSCMKNLKFPIVVLDECSQMTEPASLLPVARFECEKLILVGDPKQLPPTIQGSESAHSNSLEQTLFDRLCLMGHEPILLRTQYRCHPAISAIANDLFYEGNLLDGISEVDRSPLMDWLPTLCFYNVNGLEQVEKDNSFHNMAESFFTVKLIQSLIASGIEGAMIGVITLYKSQMSKICNLLNAVHSDASQIKAVQVSTVDAFQGAEKEIIVLSCVRTRQVGFIDSEKRVNVALTRGKRHLLIVGNLNCLRKNKLWGHVIQHCAGRKNGLQHVSQCEQRLNDIIKSYLERKKEEEINMEKKKSTS
ncbi:protein ZGRF1 isoform X10 [Rhineura floridana]|uniref:protein ZGRF1 isoform X10 n=1 Tax=Rhineura floridana TaxID=261503 RepID=UPI002AC7EA50|nr:protein ZGRF1 isoform X10 [Rhineura floridana]